MMSTAPSFVVVKAQGEVQKNQQKLLTAHTFTAPAQTPNVWPSKHQPSKASGTDSPDSTLRTPSPVRLYRGPPSPLQLLSSPPTKFKSCQPHSEPHSAPHSDPHSDPHSPSPMDVDDQRRDPAVAAAQALALGPVSGPVAGVLWIAFEWDRSAQQRLRTADRRAKLVQLVKRAVLSAFHNRQSAAFGDMATWRDLEKVRCPVPDWTKLLASKHQGSFESTVNGDEQLAEALDLRNLAVSFRPVKTRQPTHVTDPPLALLTCSITAYDDI